MLEKTVRINQLFDFYQGLLTDKQREYLTLYYLDNYSLGEIAETYKISRQAVYDNIRRTEAMLESYEERLGLVERFQKRYQLLQHVKSEISKSSKQPQELLKIIEQIEKLE